MGLKFKLDSLDGVEASQKAFYKEVNGKFELDIEGHPDGDLSAANKRLLADLKDAQSKAKALEEAAKKTEEEKKAAIAAAQKEAEEKLKKSGDIDGLTKSYEEKLAAKEKEAAAKISELNAAVYNLTVVQTATNIAAKIATPGTAEVFMPHIIKRLRYEDGKVKVLDAQGNLSALTIEELETEFKNSPAFAPLIAGPKGSGTGSQSAGGGGSGAPTPKKNETPEERAARYQKMLDNDNKK